MPSLCNEERKGRGRSYSDVIRFCCLASPRAGLRGEARKPSECKGAAHSLLISGFDASTITMGQHAESRSGSPRLVFHRYGTEYILREVWMGEASGYQLRETARERELAGNRGGANTASANFEKVEVAIQ